MAREGLATKMVWLHLWNGLTDFVQIWHAARSHTAVNDGPLKPGPGADARVHVRSPALYLRNYGTDLAQIWHAVKHHTSVNDALRKLGVLLHVRTCTSHLCISETNGPILLKFGMTAKYGIFVNDASLKPEMMLHVRTCAPFCCISETTGSIKLKFGIRH